MFTFDIVVGADSAAKDAPRRNVEDGMVHPLSVDVGDVSVAGQCWPSRRAAGMSAGCGSGVGTAGRATVGCSCTCCSAGCRQVSTQGPGHVSTRPGSSERRTLSLPPSERRA